LAWRKILLAGEPGRFSEAGAVKPYIGSPTRGWPMDARWDSYLMRAPEVSAYAMFCGVLVVREMHLCQIFGKRVCHLGWRPH